MRYKEILNQPHLFLIFYLNKLEKFYLIKIKNSLYIHTIEFYNQFNKIFNEIL